MADNLVTYKGYISVIKDYMIVDIISMWARSYDNRLVQETPSLVA